MTNFHVIKSAGFYKYLNGTQVILIGRVADSDLLRVELPGGKQIDLLDCEVLTHDKFHKSTELLGGLSNPDFTYEARVRELEAEGCTRSDAQAVADAEDREATAAAEYRGADYGLD